MTSIVLYCRPGFEKECGAEIQEKAAWLEAFGYLQITKNEGIVFYHLNNPEDGEKIMAKLPLKRLIFTRQWFVTLTDKIALPDYNRVEAIVEELGSEWQYADLRMETPDTNDGKALSKFCRKLAVPLRQALRKKKVLTEKNQHEGAVLHALFFSGTEVILGYSLGNNTSPHVMGIPRLKFPSASPSRSTLKLDEAFLYFIPKEEREYRLCSGMKAVDLGAAPGGWTYQLVRRGMMVTSIDNGPMAESLMETGQVKHRMVDGFKYEPIKHEIYWLVRETKKREKVNIPDQTPVDWLVCDMIEKPQRVVDLIIHWFTQGYCREAIVNLKLPMAKKYDTVKGLLDKLKDALPNCYYEAKHLYYDRDEITLLVKYKVHRANQR
ncbi:23S rRNA (cytidine(2498)-2'-O)-methyltransferase RlmM [Thalassotalea sp. SU-HH00458]|uniref:23S rRNA (cytidine(2498)-2'-O)-methyltransferase RlmM n=1 Tax=Thalassotalea sp. SU-HH00458 TaxID=3127657 RepID=UPI003108401D